MAVSRFLNAAAFLAVLIITYSIGRILYNIFFHPLRRFPGPLLCRATILPSQKYSLGGSAHHWIGALHKQYGAIVRFAPNQLSVNAPEGWKDMYGHKATHLYKDMNFYGEDMFGNPPGIIRANNVEHARQRKIFSHAFSDRALREQEPLLKGYVRLLIEKLIETVKASPDRKADIAGFYNFTTFDIMADLTFGEALGLLENSDYTTWVRSVFVTIKQITWKAELMKWPGIKSLLEALIPRKAREQKKGHMAHSVDRVEKRLQRETDRPDIWTNVLKYDPEGGKGLLPNQMHSNASTFMIAGTETTATELSGLTYLLLTNPDKMRRLVKEVREAFPTFDDINMIGLGQLPYLHACIEEGLRIYPPVAGGMPRKVPKEGAVIVGQFVPAGTSVSQNHWASYRSPHNFKNPDCFVPERWLPEGEKEYGQDAKMVLQPFSYGPRNCLGKNLAYLELRLILSAVLWHFDLELTKESEHWIDQKAYVLWEKSPFYVRLTPVQK